MNSRHRLSLCVTTALCVLTASTARADDAGRLADRIFGYLDKNGDGQLDAGEFAKTPVTMREWLTKNRHNPNPTLKKADFTRVFGRMMADLRQPKPDDPDRGTGAGANGGSSTTGGSSGSASLYASGQEPVEVERTDGPTSRLPSEYQAGDANRDGQIDFAEWRKWKDGQLAKFRELDVNKDSILSPRELGAAPIQVAKTQKSSPRKPVEIVAYDKLSDDMKKKFGEVIKTAYFDYLDADKSGKLEPKEWGASERIRKAFSEAKVDLDKDMEPATFVAHYSKIVGTKDTRVWKDYLEKNPPPDSSKSDGSKTDGSKSDGSKSAAGKSDDGDTSAKKDSSKSSPSSKSDDDDSYEKLSDAKKKEYRDIVKTYFEYLDGGGNKDGKLQEKEWDASSRIKPVFVNAKIDLKKEMSEADFISHYTKLVGTKDPTWQRRNPSRGKRRRRR